MTAATAPADRPALSMPKGAINALIYLYLLLGSVPALGLSVLEPLLRTDRDLLSEHLLAYVLVIGGWLLALLFVVRSGRRIGLRLFRGTALLLAAVLAAGIVASVLVTAGMVGDASRHARLSGEFAMVGFLVCAPVLLLLLLSLKRVRWLDPASSPDEWEPPARRKDVFLKTMVKARPDE